MPRRRPLYPVNLLVSGRRVLVVGGGAVAAEKARGLLAAGAIVHVVATDVRGGGAGPRRHLGGAALRAGRGRRATASRWPAPTTPSANQAVFDDGEAAGVWVNAADDPARCSYTLPARLDRGRAARHGVHGRAQPRPRRRGSATSSPPQLGPEYDTLLDLLAEARADLVAAGRPTLGADWRSALDSGMLDLVRAGRLDEARELLQASLAPADPPLPGSLR